MFVQLLAQKTQLLAFSLAHTVSIFPPRIFCDLARV